MITNYDPNNQQGIGKIFYPDFTGIIPFYFFNTLLNDFVDSGISVSVDKYILCYRVTPAIKIIADLETLPFIKVPETRYKFGNYAYVPGFEQEVIGETITNYEIAEFPEYIIYPRQFLQTRWTSIQYNTVDFDPYLVFWDEPTEATLNVDVKSAPDFFYHFGNGTGVSSLVVNLERNVTAQMVLFYWFDIINISNTDLRDLVSYPL